MQAIVLTVFGVCLGSFANAFVWRLHEQSKHRSKKTKRRYSIVHGRSMCTHCHHQLGARDLVPVLSWVSLRGKCRYCKQPIEDTPLLEVATAVLFVISYLFWPFIFDAQGVVLFVFWLVFLVGFVILAAYDVRWHLLPDKVVFPLAVLAAAQTVLLAVPFHGGVQVIIGAFWGVLIASGIFYVIFTVSNGMWIGGGDVKLGVLLGLLLGGAAEAFLMLFIASLIGTAVAVPLLLTGKASRKTHLPFGPFLITATIIVYLFGASIIHWYTSALLPH